MIKTCLHDWEIMSENQVKKLLVATWGKKNWLKPGIGGTSELSPINR